MEIVYAKDTAQIPTKECGLVLVRQGEHWPASDPVVRAAPHLFTDDPRFGLRWSGDMPPEMNDAPAETATAAPGEKRSVRRG